MKYLVHTWALWQQNRDDIQEILYNETVNLTRGWGVCRDEVSLMAITKRGYDMVAELPADDETPITDLIEEYQDQIGTAPEGDVPHL